MRRRQGFTLVELMVALALIIVIMAIISQAFVEGLETFRNLKALGDLQENLRSAVVPLREDLIARHFSNDQKLSDQTLIPGAGRRTRLWVSRPTPSRPSRSIPRSSPSARRTSRRPGRASGRRGGSA